MLDYLVFLQKVDLTSKAVTEVLTRTIEYLQPNPGESSPVLFPLPPRCSGNQGKRQRGQRDITEMLFDPKVLVTSPILRSGMLPPFTLYSMLGCPDIL